MTLYRRQALQYQQERRWGEPLLAGPLPWRWLSLFVFVLTVVTAVFLGTHRYQRKVEVAGLLMPEAGLVELTAPAQARVSGVLAVPGQQVAAGQSLLTLEFDAIGDGSQGAAVRTSLQRQRNEIERELWLQALRASEAVAALMSRQDTLRARLATSALMERQTRESLALDEQAEWAGRKLHTRGLIADNELGRQRAEVLRQRTALQRLHMERDADAAELAAQAREIELLLLEADARDATLRRSLAELTRQELQLEGDQRRVVTAPVAGTVGSLALRSGMAVMAGAPLVSLLPDEAELVAALELPGAAMGFVAPGQQVWLRLDAFPYQKFGAVPATVLRIDGNGTRPAADQAPRFRLLARLQRQAVTAFGHERRLLAGMGVQAHIVLEQRSLLEWLFEPLLSLRGHW